MAELGPESRASGHARVAKPQGDKPPSVLDPPQHPPPWALKRAVLLSNSSCDRIFYEARSNTLLGPFSQRFPFTRSRLEPENLPF